LIDSNLSKKLLHLSPAKQIWSVHPCIKLIAPDSKKCL